MKLWLKFQKICLVLGLSLTTTECCISLSQGYSSKGFYQPSAGSAPTPQASMTLSHLISSYGLRLYKDSSHQLSGITVTLSVVNINTYCDTLPLYFSLMSILGTTELPQEKKQKTYNWSDAVCG